MNVTLHSEEIMHSEDIPHCLARIMLHGFSMKPVSWVDCLVSAADSEDQQKAMLRVMQYAVNLLIAYHA